MSNTKTECEILMSSVLPFAEEMLEKNGAFFPFGGAMQIDDEIVSVGGYTGTEQPPSTEIIELIKTGFIEGARKGEYKATALVYDVRVNLPETGEKSDAISVSLNHRENYSVTVIFPYKIENGKLVFGTTYAHKGEADIFLSG